MATHLKRATLPVSREVGRKRSIVPNRARDEDLDFFLTISKQSRRALAREIDQLIRPA